MARKRSTLPWLVVLGFGLQACSTDDLAAMPPRGPDGLAIEQVEALGTDNRVNETGGSIKLGATDPLLVWIGPYNKNNATDQLGDFILAPPGGCASLTNCGWIFLEATLLVQVDPLVPNVTKTLVFETQAITSPIELNLPSEMRTDGTLTLHVELRDAWGEPVLKDDGERLSNKLSFELNVPPT